MRGFFLFNEFFIVVADYGHGNPKFSNFGQRGIFLLNLVSTGIPEGCYGAKKMQYLFRYIGFIGFRCTMPK
jgi:hypothetical protein